MSRTKYIWQFIALLGLFALLSACSGPEPDLSSSTGATTGYTVAPEFEDYYNEHGGASIFGYPITGTFIDSESGHLIQYFQHLHLEFDRPTRAITVRPLGLHYAPPEAEQTPVPLYENSDQRLFPESSYIVQDEFLIFYEANGGVALFGQPITPQFDESGKIVQYFENAQFVWNPNALPEFRVEIAPLGSTYRWQFGSPAIEDTTRNRGLAVLDADVSATLKKPILFAGDEQVLYVSVLAADSLVEVEGAEVNVTISYADQTTELTLPLTDAFGRTQATLELPDIEPGQKVQVQINATSLLDDPLGQTTLSFKTWW